MEKKKLNLALTLEKGILIFITYVFRPIWSNIIKFLFWIICLVIFLRNSTKAKLCELSAKQFDQIKDLGELCNYFRDKFKYSYDGYKGIFDHDNSRLEFFMRGGDCDDMAVYAKRKLKEFGYKPVRVFMMSGEDLKSGHMDCFFEIDNKYFLFNYGRLIEGTDLGNCISNLNNFYYNRGLYFKYYL